MVFIWNKKKTLIKRNDICKTILGQTLPLSIFLSQKKKGKKILSKIVQKMVLQTSFLLINQLQYFMPNITQQCKIQVQQLEVFNLECPEGVVSVEPLSSVRCGEDNIFKAFVASWILANFIINLKQNKMANAIDNYW